MTIAVREQVLIRRPRREVADFMFDPRNDAIWTSGVLEVRPLAEGHLTPGMRVERIARFLGRRFGYVYEVVSAENGRLVEMTVDNPFPMRIRYELDDAGEATVARILATGDGTGFFRVAGPLLEKMVGRTIRNDLRMLKKGSIREERRKAKAISRRQAEK
jgi:hypothetical protein